MALLLTPLFFHAVLLSILSSLRQMLAEKAISSGQRVGIDTVAKYLCEIRFDFDVCFAVRAG